jgi:hypothetical protein
MSYNMQEEIFHTVNKNFGFELPKRTKVSGRKYFEIAESVKANIAHLFSRRLTRFTEEPLTYLNVLWFGPRFFEIHLKKLKISIIMTEYTSFYKS